LVSLSIEVALLESTINFEGVSRAFE